MIKLVLHIGSHKTGSTAIQRLLFQHREALAAEGFCYPEVGLRREAHHELAWAAGAAREAPDEEALTSMIDGLVQASGESSNTVVVSSEEFEFTPHKQLLAPLTRHFDVRVLIYLRKQDHYLETAYNQHVRSHDLRFTGSIYQFALHYNFFERYDYGRLLGQWADVFGRENIVVRPYGTSLVGGDAALDFFSHLDLPEELFRQITAEPPRINRALHPRSIPYMARINRMSLTREQHQAAHGILRNMMPFETGFRFLRSEESARFYEKFQPGNQKLFREFLGLERDPFEELVAAPGEERWVDHEDVDPDILLALAEAIFQQEGRQRLRTLLQG